MAKTVRKEGQGEPPEKRLQALRDQAKAEGGGKAKDWFMDAMRSGGFNPDFADVFGFSQQGGMDEYLDLASSWWNTVERGETWRVAEDVPLKQLPSLTPKSLTSSLSEISHELRGFSFVTERVSDPMGERNAVMALIHKRHGVMLSNGDLDNIRSAVVTHGFIEGVTERMPNEFPQIVPWQLTLVKRSLLIFPAGAKRFEDQGFAYVGKGMRFMTGEQREYDLSANKAFPLGTPPPTAERIDVKYDTNGVRHDETRVKEMYMGVDYSKALNGFGMRLLALKRGFRDVIGIDVPVALGLYEDVRSPAGNPQAFIIVRMNDMGARGDDLLSQMNQNYISEIMFLNPDIRDAMVDGTVEGIEEVRGRLRDEAAQKMFLTAINEQGLSEFDKFLVKSKEGISSLRNSTDRIKLLFLATQMGFLQAVGVNIPPLSDVLKMADEGLLSKWRHDTETVCVLAGLCNRIAVEHGLAHEQTYAGNIRYNHVKDGILTTLCDWHDCHNLLPMSYPQAIGYTAVSFSNLMSSAFTLQKQGIFQDLGPQMVASALKGYLGEVPGFERFRLDVEPDLIAKVVESSTEVAEKYRTKGFDTALKVGMDATRHHPITNIPFAPFELIKRIYSEDKHRMLQRNFK